MAATDPGSDKNCTKGCRLKYGLSDLFNQKVLNMQKVREEKAGIKSNLFENHEDQKLFDKILDDVMIKTFDGPCEQKIFRSALLGMKDNYPEILNGDKKNMFYSPNAFNYDSRIKKYETSVADVLEEKQIVLEKKKLSDKGDSIDTTNGCRKSKAALAKKWIKKRMWPRSKARDKRKLPPTLSPREEVDLKTIQNHLKKLRPQLAEQEFVDALACFFYNQRGIFMHSLKLDTYLKVLLDKAKQYRKQNKDLGFQFTAIEKQLAEQFNISMQDLDDTSHDVLNALTCKDKPVSGLLIRKAVEEAITGNDRKNEKKYIQNIFRHNQEYTLDEVRDGVKLGKFESGCRMAGENDLLIMLPDLKLFLCIEIKRHMKQKDVEDRPTSNSDIDSNLRSASSQLKKNAGFISSMHGTILSPEWRFAKVAAISPTVYNQEKICAHCKKFILTTDIVKSPEKLEKWWNETGLPNQAQKITQKDKDIAYEEFQRFFNRMINLSSIRVVQNSFQTWTQIQGENPHHMAAGHTKPSNELIKKADAFAVQDILGCAHNAYKTLYFNRDQMALLTTDSFPFALFLCDFGAGNKM